jgi:cytochrome c553
MKKALLCSMLLALAGVVPAAHAQQATATNATIESKVAMCIGCHGIKGYQASFPEVHKVPMISGQGAKYITSALGAYRKGDRKHPTMRGISDSLSDQDIADVAAYYENNGQTSTVLAATPAREPSPAVAQLLTKGACVSCHGANFSKPIDPTYPKLAGQYSDYLYAALKAYKSDSHNTWGRNNAVMSGVAKQFSQAELKALATYVASLDTELKTVAQPKFK